MNQSFLSGAHMMKYLFIAFATLALLPADSVTAATLNTSAVVRNHDHPTGGGSPKQVLDADSTDAIASNTVVSLISGSGTSNIEVPSAGVSSGDEINSSSAVASINYATGEFKAVAEATSTLCCFQGFQSSGSAKASLSDLITFSYDPTNPVIDLSIATVTFQWHVEWDIIGLGSFDTLFRVNDTDPATGGYLFQVDEQFTASGFQLFTWEVLLADLPSLVALDIEIWSRAQSRTDGDDRANWIPYSLTDAGNTGVLNIIAPEGVTFAGTGTGFLSEMRLIGDEDIGVVPLPASLPLIGAGLFALGLLRGRSMTQVRGEPSKAVRSEKVVEELIPPFLLKKHGQLSQ